MKIKSAVFFYSFNVRSEQEREFSEYMTNYGTPMMSKYCKNWNFFKLHNTLTGVDVPQYLGHFEIPDLDEFLNSEPPEEMKKTIERATEVTINRKEWITKVIDSNSNN
jgi:hypothetical protein